ncbi:MAG: hypothetical protein ABIO19_05445, partial [Burkholderiaceae bacterium]
GGLAGVDMGADADIAIALDGSFASHDNFLLEKMSYADNLRLIAMGNTYIAEARICQTDPAMVCHALKLSALWIKKFLLELFY